MDYHKNLKLFDFEKWIQGGETLLIEEAWDAPKALLSAIAQRATKKNLVILSGGVRETRLFDDFPYFKMQPLEFPAWENLPSEEIAPSPDIVGERYKILREISEKKEPLVIVTSLQAALQKVLPPDRLEKLHLVLRKNETTSFETLSHILSEMGYHRKSVAADKGEYAVRGGIIDIFPVSSPDPFRIEFWEDEIVSIRKYDPIGQTSVGKVDEILITPGEEYELMREQTQLVSLFDYLGRDTVVIFDDIAAIEDKYVALKSMAGIKSHTFFSLEEILQQISELQKIYFSQSTLEELTEVRILDKGVNPYSENAPPQKIAFSFFNKDLIAHRWRHPFLSLFPSFCPPDRSLEDFSANDFLESLSHHQIELNFITSSESEERNLKEKLALNAPNLKPQFNRGYLSSGFYLHEPPFALIPMTELTHRYKVRRQKQRTHYQSLPVEMLTLTPGEAVVHMNNGIGRYLGIEKRPNHLGVETEFMLLEYAEGSKLYVPMEQANMVSKYIGASDHVPQLHTIGSARWKRSREKTEQAIIGYAADLLKMHAERAIKEGFAYPADSDLVQQFFNEFPYVETPDQLAAIQKVNEDMQSTRSMDRLVCGDVGYGKTEVAMRAAFKAVVDGGKQVAVLVPTTVLAMQHFETFSDRMANFPINIGILSRFQKPKEIRDTLQAVSEGKIDILVGTHRIVSDDVIFKNLGLVVIDEEQRFGVRTKEHLKKIKTEVDCLTLSATPIPRTLYMSLVGARDLSVINTPPDDRLPIQSIVCQTNEELIKNALLRELARDGQAYFIHNRVESIYEVADKIRSQLPGAHIVVGHGQMDAKELDMVFHAFKSGKANILVATSIIENGIDIPNANTILIDRADRFGMADLYQMRGRVGRWNRKAFCYFLVSNTQTLNEIARKRLTALSQSSGHGGGMKIAMHDLEIRGAGNILGEEQSGHVETIGFHLYCKLLKKAINALQKKSKPSFLQEVKMEFPFDARLPEEYVNDVTLRMDFYQRLGDTEDEEEVDLLIEEIVDRFGPPPSQVGWLKAIAKLRLFASRNHFTLLKLSKTLFLAEQSHGKKEKISKKVIVKIPKTPEELTTTITQALKENFPIKD